MDYIIKPVSADYVLAHAHLIQEHYEEVSSQSRPLAPSREKYLALEKAGVLVGLGAFHGAGLVGYSATIVDRNIHYDMVMAYNSALYVHPDYRATPLGLRLMAETRKACKAKGAHIMLWHAKPESQLNALLQRKKFKVQDIVYQEQL